jgi:predicted unusual protein kinase regulating ubiquinone biosynthesis (AarF/ABC1/UbiB family)
MVKEGEPRSTLRRGFRLGKLGFSLTGSYLGYQVQNLILGEKDKAKRRRRFQQKTSSRIRGELESLKGPVMKLGQLLSMQTQALPEEAIRELASLQMQAPGMHPTLARAQFKNSCGKYPEEVFREFSLEPFAAASLGQVHRAVTRRGEPVAVKIQYPAIRSAIENDFKLLRSATFPGRLTGHAPAAILNEVERGFLEETDYLTEGKNLDFFRERMQKFAYLTIPRVHWELTTDRVLTMSLLEGTPANQFLRTNPPQLVRDRIGSRLFEMYYFQIQRLRVLHADHHPGNFLFQADGRIGLVDFGCVKRLSIDAGEIVRCCLERVWEQGQKQADHLLALVFGPAVPIARARKMLTDLSELASVLFPVPENGAGTLVDFAEPELLQTQARAMKRALRDKATNPEFAFVSRTELGLYNLLHQLRARVDTRDVWRRLQSLPDATMP